MVEVNEKELNEIKEYLRVDAVEENPLIKGFILAAKNYLLHAGVPEPKEENKLYDLVTKMLVSLFYENREPSEKSVDVPPVIQNFITQLSISHFKSGGG